MAGKRADLDAIASATHECKNFHSTQQGHLGSYASTEASLRGNWMSVESTKVFDEKSQQLQRSAREMQQAIEDMQTSLQKYSAQVNTTAQDTASLVNQVDIPTARSYGI